MNPLVESKIFIQLPDEVKLLVSDYMITPAASIKLLQSQINWCKQMEAMNDALVAPDELPEGILN